MKKYLYILILAPILFACSKHEPPEAQKNQFGGLNRTNNFEYIGKFFAQSIRRNDFNEPAGATKAPLPINENQIAVALNDRTIALCEENSIKWKAQLGDKSIASNLGADINSNIYALDASGELFSISKDGKLNWRTVALTKKEQWTIYSDILVNSEGVVCACSAGELALIGFDGKIKWTKDFSASPIDRFAGDKDGNIYLPISNNEFGKTDTLIAIDKNGNIKWRSATPSARAYITPCVGEKTIYLAGFIDKGDSRTSSLFSINKENGQINWQKEMPQKIRSVSLNLDGTVYLVLGDIGLSESISQIVAIKENSEQLWSNYLQNSIITPIFVSKDRLAFIGAQGEAYGLFIVASKSGDLMGSLTLTDHLPFIATPAVTQDGDIVLAGSGKLSLIRINEPAINKVLPI